MTLNFLSLVNGILLEIDENEVSSSQLEEAESSNRELKRVKNWINRIYRNIALKRPDWSWLRMHQSFSTTAGQSAYTPGDELNSATDLEKVFLVQLNARPPMELLSDLEFKRFYGDSETSASGEPSIAYITNNSLKLYPTPSHSFSVNLISARKVSVLVNATDEPLIPEEKRDVLHHGALMLAKNFDNDIDQQIQQQFFVDALQGLIASERNNHKGDVIQPEETVVAAESLHSILSE